jgi:protein TonB
VTFDAQPQGRGVGIAVVVGVHVLIGWALASGLARQVIDVVKKPIEMSLIPEMVTPPPPPPPPKVEKIETVKPHTPPPPAYVPPPEVVAPVQTAPTISAVQSTNPAPPPPVAAPAPPPVEAKPAPVKREVSLACPGYEAVLAQALEDAIDRVGITGVVRSRLTVRGEQVVDVTPLSGPKEYYKYVQAAVKRMKCSAGGADEVQVSLDVTFSK